MSALPVRFKAVLALLAAFVAGICVGAAFCLFHPEWTHGMDRLRLHRGPETAARHVSRKLDLSEAQARQVLKVFLRHHPQMEAEMARARAFRDAFMAEIFQEIAPLLTPEQAAKAEKFRQQRQKRAKSPPEP